MVNEGNRSWLQNVIMQTAAAVASGFVGKLEEQIQAHSAILHEQQTKQNALEATQNDHARRLAGQENEMRQLRQMVM